MRFDNTNINTGETRALQNCGKMLAITNLPILCVKDR